MKPQVAGNMAIGLASINLSVRTYVPNLIMLNLGLTMSEWDRMAVWDQSRYIVAPLIVCILGHWSLLMHGESNI